MNFNERFNLLRKERGETLRDVCLAVGVGVGTVQAWTKEARPHPDAASRLAKHYGLTPAELLEDSVSFGLHEDQSPYGGAESLTAEIRRYVEHTISAADGDRVRLAWVLSQIKEHVTPQGHWKGGKIQGSAELRALAKLESLKARAAAAAAASSTPAHKTA